MHINIYITVGIDIDVLVSVHISIFGLFMRINVFVITPSSKSISWKNGDHSEREDDQRNNTDHRFFSIIDAKVHESPLIAQWSNRQ